MISVDSIPLIGVPSVQKEILLEESLLACKAIVDAWERGDLAAAAQRCAEVVAEVEFE